jgi:diguanylate cyclase
VYNIFFGALKKMSKMSKMIEEETLKIEIKDALIEGMEIAEVKNISKNDHDENSSFNWDGLPKIIRNTNYFFRANKYVMQKKINFLTDQFNKTLKNVCDTVIDDEHDINEVKSTENNITLISKTLLNINKHLKSDEDFEILKKDIEEEINVVIKYVKDFNRIRNNRVEKEYNRNFVLNRQIDDFKNEMSRLSDNLTQEKSNSINDKLTNVLNRRGYEIKAKVFQDIFYNRKTKVTMVICDIDNFKILNDTYGHHAGDRGLQKIAQIMKSTIRENDIVARYGGEEFVILIKGQNIKDSIIAINRIRKDIENFRMPYKNRIIRMTASFGVSCMIEGDDFVSLFERADNALYMAKKLGKNRVIIEKPSVRSS